MTVKKRLVLNVALTTAGIFLILAVSIFATLKIKSSVHVLTARSTPLQIKTLELRQILEKVSADLMRLGFAEKSDDAEKAAKTIEADLKSIETVSKTMLDLDAQKTNIDTSAYEDIYKAVKKNVDQRMQNIALFKAEAENVNTAFKKVEMALSTITDNIVKLNMSAKNVVSTAQESSVGLNSSIKKLMMIQLTLKDIKTTIAEMDTVKNKYKLTPLKERTKAYVGSVQSIPYKKGDPEIIKKSKDILIAVCEQILKEDSGLIALKAASLIEGGEDAGYQSHKKDIAAEMDSVNYKIAEYIDGSEIKIVKENENMSSSYNFQSLAETVTEAGFSINVGIKELSSGVRLAMLSQSLQELNGVAGGIGKTKKRIIEDIGRLKSALKTARQDTMLKNADNMLQALEAVSLSIERIISAKQEVIASESAMQKSIEIVKETSMRQSSEGEEQLKTIGERQRETVERVDSTVNASLLFLVVASLLILTAVIVISGKTTISIIKPLKATEEMIDAVEKGDLTRKIEVMANDEIGQMSKAFNALIERLRHTLSLLSEKSNTINTHAGEISKSVGHQALFTAQLSSSVSEISSTMEELSASSSQIAEHTTSVAEIAEGSLRNAREGSHAVGTVTGKLNEINGDNQRNIAEIVALGKKSKEIVKVMEIIYNIADQTKLIAFNAALEASSAGEAGKRFGVVAGEIRRLADNVTESTVEIEGKVNEIQEAITRLVITSEKGAKGIQEGVEHSTQTVSMLNDIVSAVESTTTAAKQISLSTQQQKTANRQIVASLKDIVAGTGQTSKAIDGINDISKELAALSEDLNVLVRQFRLNDHQAKEES
jgi:methyl-accepting chemotaxis protein